MHHDLRTDLPRPRSASLPATFSVAVSVASLLCLLTGPGCGPAPDRHPAEAAGHASGHHHLSPHGGRLVELGEHQFQLDVLHDATAGTLKAWILDAHAEAFIRVPLRTIDGVIDGPGSSTPLPLALAAQADPATGETVGDTSHFAAQNPALVGRTNLTLRIPLLEIRGATFKDVRFQCSTLR